MEGELTWDREGAETPLASPQPTTAADAKAARRQRQQERRLAKKREAEEEQRAELLRERRKRHRRLQKSLPEGSEDQVERWAKTFRKKVRRAYGLPAQGSGYRPGALMPRPDVGAALRTARRSVLGVTAEADTDSERE